MCTWLYRDDSVGHFIFLVLQGLHVDQYSIYLKNTSSVYNNCAFFTPKFLVLHAHKMLWGFSGMDWPLPVCLNESVIFFQEIPNKSISYGSYIIWCREIDFLLVVCH